jgi:hypothetical protein
MATIHILGRDFAIAPYKLGELRRAAPFIDNIQRKTDGSGSLSDLMDSAVDLLNVLSIGLVKIDPVLTADYLEANVSMDEFVGLQTAFLDLSEESGLQRKGEATAPPAAVPEGASSEHLPTSSTI